MDNGKISQRKGVSPANTMDEYIKHVIIAACKINRINPEIVNPFIPKKQGLRNTFAFKCLLNVSVTPKLTKTAYARLYNNCQQATYHALAYLKELGLVFELGKPRLIKPLQRYIIDKGYNITPKGEKVIRDVLTLAKVF